MPKELPWNAQLGRRKELLHTGHSAMTLHGQLRNQRGALHRAWPPPGSLSHGGKRWTVLLSKVGACSSRDWGGKRSPVRPCHGRGSLACSSSKRPQSGCFGSLSHPCSSRKQGLELFCWRWKFSNYLPQWGQIASTNLFLRVSFSPSVLVFFPLLFHFTFYLLKTKMSACWMSCIGRGSAGVSQPLMSLGGEASLGAKGGSTTGHALKLKCDQNKQTK